MQLSLPVAGYSPFTYSVVSGALPPCIHLSASNGTLTGTPAASCAGTYAFRVGVVDNNGDEALTAQRFVIHVTDGKTVIATPSGTAMAGVARPVQLVPAAPALAPAAVPDAEPDPAHAATDVPALAPPPPVPASPVACIDCRMALGKVTAGAIEVTADSAIPNATYILFNWPKPAPGAAPSAPVQLAIAIAAADGSLDFRGISTRPAAGDTLRILTAQQGEYLLDALARDPEHVPVFPHLPDVVVAAAPVPPGAQAPESACSGCPIVLDKVTAGDLEVTADNAIPNVTYSLFDWPKPSAGTPTPPPTQIASIPAGADGSLDFRGVTSPLNAGDTLHVLTPDQSQALLDAIKDTPQDLPNESVEPGTVVVAPPSLDAPRVIVGYQQSGANSANSQGRLFVDVYYSRALRRIASSTITPARVRFFGDSRIAGSAQNSSATIGTFVAGLSGTQNTLQLNQIASVAEFLTGMELSLLNTAGSKPSRFSLFGEYGASGRLQALELNTTYAFPANTTQSYNLLVAAEQKSPGYNPNQNIQTTCIVGSSPSIPGVANNCMFIQFAQQQPYFDQEAYLGLKSIWFFTNRSSSSSAPDVMSIGFGANNAVNRDMSFNAMRVEGFVPFDLPAVKGGTKPTVPVFYLYGYANLALDHSHFPATNNFINLNAVSSVVANNVAQTPSASNTYTIYTKPTAQEFYSIGVGVDLVNLWATLFGPAKKGD